MAEGNNTPILVAAIGAAATLGVGMFANWDKISGGKSTAEAAPSTEAAADIALDAEAAPAADAAALEVPANVDGAWTESDYGTFRFAQTGGVVTFEHDDSGGTHPGTGEIEGRYLKFRYNIARNEVQWWCDVEVAAGDQSMSGSCKDSNEKNFDIKLTREPAV